MENNIITYNVNFNEDQIKQLYLLISGEKRCAVSMEEMVQYISQYASSIDPRCVISTCEDVKAIYSSLLNRIPTDEEYGYYTGKNTIEYVLCKTYLSKEHQTQKETFVSAADMHKILLSLWLICLFHNLQIGFHRYSTNRLRKCIYVGISIFFIWF